VNSTSRDLSPTLTSDELVMIFTRGDNPRSETLMMSVRRTTSEPFGPAQVLPVVPHAESPSLTGDGLELFFRHGHTAETMRIWHCRRASRNDPFGEPKPLANVGVYSAWHASPAVSADGLSLLVTTTPRGNNASGEITLYTRPNRDADFGNEVVFPAPINSPAFDISSWVSNDRTVLVRQRMENKRQETRFHTRPTPTAEFGPAQSFAGLPEGIEVGRPWLSPDGERMYFHTRDLDGGNGQVDLWVTKRKPKRKS
jgi:hypothetical protein